MAISLNLLKDKNFQNWYFDMMLNWLHIASSRSKDIIRGELADSFNSELNMLSFMLTNLYPFSRPTNDKYRYVFITNPLEHDLYTKGQKFYPGRLFLTFENLGHEYGGEPRMEFPDVPQFVHGYVEGTTRRLTCYGGYAYVHTMAQDGGFSGVLGDMHNFACKSKASTYMKTGAEDNIPF